MNWEVIEHNWKDVSVYDEDTAETICTLSLDEEKLNEDNQDAMYQAQLKKANLIAAAPKMWRILKKLYEGESLDSEIIEIESIVNSLGEL